MADGNRQQGFGFHATGASKLRHGEIVVDLFAGGGGASEALRQALGRDPDICINHDAWAIGMHAANHPLARHLCEDVRLIDLFGTDLGRTPAGHFGHGTKNRSRTSEMERRASYA